MNHGKIAHRLSVPHPATVCGILAAVLLVVLLVPSISRAADTVYRTLTNREAGIRFEYPAGWRYGANRDGALVIRGRKGTPPQFAIITVQTLPGLSDAAGELEAVLARFRKRVPIRILLKGEEKLAGEKASFYVIRYKSPLNRQPVAWKHIIAAVAHGGFVYLLSYRAPESIFERYKKHFNHLVLSLSFPTPPSAAAPPRVSAPPKRKTASTPPSAPRFVKGNGWIRDRVSGYRFRLPRGWRHEVKKDVVYAFSRSGRAGFFALGEVVEKHVDAEAWADAAEKALSGQLGFMEKRLLHSGFKYLGYVPEGMKYVVRDYEGRVDRIPVRGHVLYATYGLRVYVAGVFLSRRVRRGAREIADVLNDFETTIDTLEEASVPKGGASGAEARGKGGSTSIGAPAGPEQGQGGE